MDTGRKIKWRNQDEAQLKKAVNNFNAKIRRLEKKSPELKEVLPEKLSLKTERQKLQEQPRQTYNREIKSLKRFTRPDSEKIVQNELGLKTTKWMKNEMSIQMRVINNRKTRERNAANNLEVTTQGIQTGFKRAEMGSLRMNDLKPKKFNFEKIHPGKEWDMFVQSVEKQSAALYSDKRAAQAKVNYMSVLHNQLGAYADDIILKVNSMTDKEFMTKMYEEQEASFEFIRSPEDAKNKIEILNKIWGVDGNLPEDYTVTIKDLQFAPTP